MESLGKEQQPGFNKKLIDSRANKVALPTDDALGEQMKVSHHRGDHAQQNFERMKEAVKNKDAGEYIKVMEKETTDLLNGQRSLYEKQ